MLKEKNYEVFKFIEHDRRCHAVMDCASGTLLADRLNDCSNLTKETVFYWFKMMTSELEKYHRCRQNRCYRYINPYSILVTFDNRIMLLNLNAPSNAFVMKHMQKPFMREHFVKPAVHIKENSRLPLDLYGLGKTMQFILAHTEPSISLTRRDVCIISAIIAKCLGESPGKKYDSLKQLQKDLPTNMNKKPVFNLIRNLWKK